MENSASLEIARTIAKVIRDTLFNKELDMKAEPSRETDRVLYGQKIANIVIAGAEMRLIFKLHYTDILGENLMRRSGMNGYISNQKIDDFFLECCNMIGGRIKQIFSEKNSNVGISIPIRTKGFDELFFTLGQGNEFCSEWHWDLCATDSTTVHCSLFIEILDSSFIFNLDDYQSSQVEEMEFF